MQFSHAAWEERMGGSPCGRVFFRAFSPRTHEQSSRGQTLRRLRAERMNISG